MFSKVLVANRGAIACRIIRTLRRMGVGSVAVYSEADRHSLHVDQADESVCLGPGPAAQSYLSIAAILDAARKTGAVAIHPGYGFLSENAAFAEACAQAGIVFIGPTPEQMRAFGLKHTARAIAGQNGVPLLPGTELLESAAGAIEAARRIGYPVMLKSTAGGGGIGMRLCASEEELGQAYEAVERLSHASFGTGGLYLEKFVTEARHIEVQIFGDGAGSVIALGERDCSAQRRNQKVIEETPAPGIAPEARAMLLAAAIRLGEAVQYRSAGTVEFIYDNRSRAFYFLEVNTRLQVEHGVTEEVTGVDLVEWMVRQAAGVMVPLRDLSWTLAGCSLEVRIYAEDPARNFQPCAGRLSHVEWPRHARVETWVESGSEVTPYYDPMLAKIILHGEDRPAALLRLRAALADCRIAGIETNLEYVRQVCAGPAFEAGGILTAYLRDFPYRRHAVEVIESGTQTTIQDYPGRIGYWHVGVPPSGPMDALAFRTANRLVGNAGGAAGLEIAVTGPTLRFGSDAIIAVTGADFGACLDGVPLAPWHAVRVATGSTLEMASAQASGSRAYLAISGGFDVPDYLGSRSTFILGRFGGHAGRVLAAGDVLHVGLGNGVPAQSVAPPRYTGQWEIGVLYGPHGAPDFFTAGDIDVFFATAWKVHYNSDRTGVRLIGPKPVWARKDGGEAGLHPSNIHDNAYAVGTIDFTGDMPVILGPDGPSLGGFVCPATIVDAELWKIGQLRPGDLVRFRAISLEQAADMERALDASIASLSGDWPGLPDAPLREDPVLAVDAGPERSAVADSARRVAMRGQAAAPAESPPQKGHGPIMAVPQNQQFPPEFPASVDPARNALRVSTRAASADTTHADASVDTSANTNRISTNNRTGTDNRTRVSAGADPTTNPSESNSDAVGNSNMSVGNSSGTSSSASTNPSDAGSSSGNRMGANIGVVYRADGDKYLLVEYGPNVLDLNLRFRVHALEAQLRAASLLGVLDITPGVRSLHIHYDGRQLRREMLLEALADCERRIPDLDDIVVPSRIVHLPLSWDDPATQLAIRKYMQSVRADAPWCPSNIEFIRRINGLDSIDEVRRIVFAANYLVLGLGDVYLGAPVATPADPRHRLVTTKYNPARTWTPENAVGIGGAYLCVYGMEGPGGYQFVGRTVQMWNTFRSTREFEPGTPWLLRFFDQIRFEPVSAEELLEIRDGFPHGRYPLSIERQDFRLKDYHAFLASIETQSATFKQHQQEAFEAERERWAAAGADQFVERQNEDSIQAEEEPVPAGCRPVRAPVTASVWNIAVEPGQRVEMGQRLIVLEAMKMEIAVSAPAAGIIEKLNCVRGALVSAGQQLITLRQER